MKSWFILLFATTLSAQQPTWVKLGGPIGGLGYNVRIHPTNKNIMYVTDAWSGVNKSTDAGQTWFASNTGITTRLGPSTDAIPIFSLTIDPQNPNVVWAGTQGLRGIFKSTDGGSTWTERDNGVVETNGITIRNFQLHPTNSNIVFAACEYTVGVQGREFDKVMGILYKTTDGGNTWTKILQDSSLFRWMCISQTNPNAMNLFTGIFDREALNTVGKGVLRSNDGGTTWSPLNSGIQGSLFIGGMSMVGSNIVIGTGNYSEDQLGTFGGIFLTTNAGGTWTLVQGPHAPQSPGDQDNVFTAAAFAPSNTSIVYVGNAVAFYRSSSGGIAGSWTRMTGPNGTPYGPPGARAGIPIEVTVDKDDPNTVFVNNYGGGVFKSTDGAQTWQILGKGYTGADIHKIAVNPQNRSSIFVTGRSGPFKSTNAGDDWTGVFNGPVISGLSEYYSVAIHPTNGSALLVGDEHQGVILRSSDAGASWVLSFRHPLADASNPNTRQGIRELQYAPSNPQIVYAGFSAANFFTDNFDASFPNSFGVYKSTDGGLNPLGWVAKNAGLEATNLNITSMAISPTDPSLLYIGTRGNGIYKTTNGGDQWMNVTNNLPTAEVYSVAISSTNSNLVYAGTRSSGLFKSTNGGTSWSLGLAPLAANPSFASKLIIALVVHPKNDSVAFASDWRSGVYRTTDAGATWQLVSTGLSTRAASTLAISADGLYLYAGTKGEGMFRLQTSVVSAPSTPTLVSPANTATNQTITPALTWSPVSNADSYRLQVSTSANFGSFVLDDSTLTGTTRSIGPLSNSTTYYWRIAAKNLGGSSSFSAAFSFSTIVAAPATPTLLSPANGAINQALNLSIQWNPVSGTDTYRVQLATNQNFSPVLIDDSTLTASSKSVGPLSLNTTYYWRVAAKNLGGTSTFSAVSSFKTIVTTQVEPFGSGVPAYNNLNQNYPNPFNPSTTIRYGIPNQTHVLLEVYNLLGQRVAMLVDEEQPAAFYQTNWNAVGISSGLYFYRLQAGSFIETKKLLLLK